MSFPDGGQRHGLPVAQGDGVRSLCLCWVSSQSSWREGAKGTEARLQRGCVLRLTPSRSPALGPR